MGLGTNVVQGTIPATSLSRIMVDDWLSPVWSSEPSETRGCLLNDYRDPAALSSLSRAARA
jgi:hypothetical protein